MHFIKTFFRGLFTLGFKFTLGLLVVAGSVAMVLGTPVQIKQSLQDSKIYDNAVDQFIENTAKNNGEGADNPFSHPEVQAAAKTAVTPVFFQTSAERIIDGVYGWLNGKTAQPQFAINIGPIKQRFEAAVGDFAVNRAKQLPACTLAQTIQLAASTIDPLQVTCIPKGFDVENLRALIAAKLNTKDAENKDNILQQTTITPETLPKDDNGKTAVQNLTEKGKYAPKIFHLLMVAPPILGGLAILLAGLVILFSDSKRRGLHSIASSLGVVGTLTLLSILLTNVIYSKLTQADGPLTKVDNHFVQPAAAAAKSMTAAFNHALLLYGAIYVALATGIAITLIITRSRSPKVDATKPEEPQTTETPTEEPVPTESQKPVESVKPNPPQLVQ